MRSMIWENLETNSKEKAKETFKASEWKMTLKWMNVSFINSLASSHIENNEEWAKEQIL